MMFLTLCEVEVYSESRGISEFNLLIQLSEVTSPYNIHTISSKQVMRILKVIRKEL